MFKLLLLLMISVSSLSVFAESRTRYFLINPELDSNLEAFLSSFIQGFAPEISESKFSFDFSKDAKGFNRTDLAYGLVAGSYSGFAKVPESNKVSPISLNFNIQFSNAPMGPDGRDEYLIKFNSNGAIKNTENFVDFFFGILMPECSEKELQGSNNLDVLICDEIKKDTLSPNKSDIENAHAFLTFWKKRLLDGLKANNDENFKAIRSEFIAYVDQNIRIEKLGDRVNLSIEMSDLKERFFSKGKAFLQSVALTDYVIQKLNVVTNRDEIIFSLDASKLHVQKSIKSRLLALKLTPNFILSVSRGLSFGADKRRSQSLSELKDSSSFSSSLGNTNDSADSSQDKPGVWGSDLNQSESNSDLGNLDDLGL